MQHLPPGAHAEAKAGDDRRGPVPSTAGCRGEHVTGAVHRLEVDGVPLKPVALLRLIHHVGLHPPGPHLHGRRVGVHQPPPLLSVLLGEKHLQRDIREVRVGVVVLPIREGQLGALDVGVEVLQGVMAHRGEVVALQEVQLLEEDRPLTPGIALVDIVAPVVGGDRLLDAGPVPGHVLQREEAVVLLAVDIPALDALHVVDYRLGDGPSIEVVPGGLDPGGSPLAPSPPLGLRHKLEGPSPVPVPQHGPDLRSLSPGQVGLSRPRPLRSEPLSV